MTTTPKESTEEGQELSYYIDIDRIEAHGRSAEALVGDRRCDTCKALPPKNPPKGKKAIPVPRQYMNTIRTHCGQQPDYLSPEMPVLETSFRLMMAAKTQPVTLSDLHQQLSDMWINSPLPRHITREALARVLAHDTYYGMAVIEPEVEEKPEPEPAPVSLEQAEVESGLEAEAPEPEQDSAEAEEKS